LYAWLLNNLAKQFIKQAENEVAVNFKKAFPLASLCLLLVCQHPEFLDFVLGRLYKKCPYLIPKYHRKEPSDSADDLRKKAGYRRRDDVEWENEEQFQERMNGMMAFLAAMVQTDLRPCTPHIRFYIIISHAAFSSSNVACVHGPRLATAGAVAEHDASQDNAEFGGNFF
jgi:hypothetical protein